MDEGHREQIRQELRRKRRALVMIVVGFALSVVYAVVVAALSGLWVIPVLAFLAGAVIVGAAVRRYHAIEASVRAAGYDG